MKHMKTIEVPARTDTIVDHVTCDLCGNIIDRERFDAEDVTVKHRTGESYPEGGMGQETSVDMCGKCFDEKLIPWLISHGANPETRKWDW